jgi:hypothetical protein
LQAFQQALTRVDAATVHIVRTFFPDSRAPPPRERVYEILDRFTTTNLSSRLLAASQTESSSISCNICFEDYAESDAAIVLPCHSSHHFHQIFIRVRTLFLSHYSIIYVPLICFFLISLQDWLQRLLPQSLTCPICRASVGSNDTRERNSLSMLQLAHTGEAVFAVRDGNYF